MEKKARKKGPVWEHFNIESKKDNAHPHVRCKYCPKDFKRAVPGRMQEHLNKSCPEAPDNAKSQPCQQNIQNVEKPSFFELPNTEDCNVHLGYHYQVEAFRLFEEAAEKGDIDSIYQLGNYHQSGIGTERNETKAFELYNKAAKQGHLNSIYQLGYCYQKGIGIEKDEIKALELYEFAAKNGHADSIHQCFILGVKIGPYYYV